MSINDLKANFSDFLRPNLYTVYIFPRATFFEQDQYSKNLIGMLCHQATLPFYTYTTNSMWFDNRETHFVNKIDYDPATFVFYADRENRILRFFDAWRAQIMDDSHRLNYYDEYISEVEIEIFDRQFNVAGIATMNDAYPVNVESIQLGYASRDAIMEVQVTFQFKSVSYEFFELAPQDKVMQLTKPWSWKDFLTVGNLRRGVNMISKMKNYRRVISNPTAYDIVTQGRKAFSATKGLGGASRSVSGRETDLVSTSSKLFKHGQVTR
jgi:hypothetical protein